MFVKHLMVVIAFLQTHSSSCEPRSNKDQLKQSGRDVTLLSAGKSLLPVLCTLGNDDRGHHRERALDLRHEMGASVPMLSFTLEVLGPGPHTL